MADYPTAKASATGGSTNKDAASNLLARWNRMKTDRMVWMTQWDTVALYCIPRKGNILTKWTPGQQQTINLYDTTAGDAGGVFAAGCVTHICPAGEKWIRLEAKGKEAPPAVKAWYDAVTDKLMDTIYDSNFYEAIHETFISAGHFASALLFQDEDEEEMFNFAEIPVGKFAWQEDCRGRVSRVAREWQWTAAQAAEKWGIENLGKMQAEAMKSTDANSSSRMFTYVHIVEPREGVKKDGPETSPNKRPFRSCYLCVEDCQLIEEGGYYTMPYFGSRLLKSNDEVYGRGPGIDKLPEIRLVNAMVRDYLVAMEKKVNPPWLAGNDADFDPDGRPGGRNYWDATSPAAGKPEQMQLKNDVGDAKEMINETRDNIRVGYYNDMFKMLTNLEESKREKTAYEVQQMVAEKLILFSPLFGRMTRELLNPLIARSFDIMARRSAAAWLRGEDGVLPLPPQELRQNPGYNIVYVSKIALAIKAAENQSLATMMTLIEQASALDQSAAFIVDIPGGLRRVAHNIGIRANLIRSERQVAQMQQAQQEAAAAQQAPAQADLAASAVKNLGPEAQAATSRKIIAASGKAA